ncbi:MAG: DUF4157 domain-containing protein [Chitinophagaceae bacterium]|nr:DUF4157 domain-containing protein [Chitinophagaceae bacterium]
MKVQLKENSWLAKLAAARLKADKVAIVFGKTIHLHNTPAAEFLADKQWVCHELKHVEQYRQNGFVLFLAKYLYEWMRHGYFNNKYEKEARASENDQSLLKKTSFIL